MIRRLLWPLEALLAWRSLPVAVMAVLLTLAALIEAFSLGAVLWQPKAPLALLLALPWVRPSALLPTTPRRRSGSSDRKR